ncbi:MAG: hypothetical protein ACXAAH_13155, partial [Promethearchaeota archaeon]
MPDKSVDLMICDLPYGETNCKWDTKIDMVRFWEQFKRIRKSKRTACIHFCSTKFGYTLIKSNEKMFKMDMVWKKRNKTGGLQSRHRPMRNHEMVYFFYEQAPMYNRDKYHKRIQAKKEHNIEKEGLTMGNTNKMKNTMHKCFEPPNPASVVEEEDQVYSKKGWKHGGQANSKEYRDNMKAKGLELKYEPPNPASVLEEKDEFGWDKSVVKEMGTKFNGSNFEPPNPVSVVEEKDTEGQKKAKVWGYEKCTKSFDDNEKVNGGRRMGANYDPPNPVSVVEEKPKKLRDKLYSTRAKEGKDIFGNNDTRVKPFNYDPPNPASVVEENDTIYSKKGWKMGEGFASKDGNKEYLKQNPGYEPRQPGSVVIPAEDEPVSMFES